MFTEAVSRKTLESLDLVARAKVLPSKTYLAGGTAAALHLAHRYSYDLDFFTPRRFAIKATANKFKKIKGFRIGETAWQSVLGVFNSVRCSLLFYQYPLLFPTSEFRGIQVADLRDIAAMKVAALSERGKKRDFVDLYFIIREGGITTLEAIHFFGRKYNLLEANKVHILKSITYFEDAEKDKMPRMIKPISWTAVKKFFISEQKRIAKELLAIE